jgi:hypothetical protein
VPNLDDSLPPSGQTIDRAFEALVTTLNERGVRYAIIGGLAVIQHARVRTTDDIDVLVVVPQIALPGLLESLRDRGFGVDILKNIREFRDGLTTIHFGDVIIDLMQPVIPAYAHVLDRAIDAQILGQTARIGSAEGLIVTKLIAMRPQGESATCYPPTRENWIWILFGRKCRPLLSRKIRGEPSSKHGSIGRYGRIEVHHHGGESFNSFHRDNFVARVVIRLLLNGRA